jgi:hypothetical protein
LFLPIIASTLSSTKLEIRAKLFLQGIQGVRGKREGAGGGGGKGMHGGNGGEITQTLYAHMNKII